MTERDGKQTADYYIHYHLIVKTFDNEWVLQSLDEHPSCFTKRMFGGLAIYLFGRMMMILVEPTKTGRWNWHGVLFPTEREHHPGILQDFSELAPHDFLKKWLFIDSRHDDFEPAMERVLKAIARNDQRFGIRPNPKSRPPRMDKRVLPNRKMKP